MSSNHNNNNSNHNNSSDSTSAEQSSNTHTQTQTHTQTHVSPVTTSSSTYTTLHKSQTSFCGRFLNEVLNLPWDKVLAALLSCVIIYIGAARLHFFNDELSRLKIDVNTASNEITSLRPLKQQVQSTIVDVASLETRLLKSLRREVKSVLYRLQDISDELHVLDKRITMAEVKMNLLLSNHPSSTYQYNHPHTSTQSQNPPLPQSPIPGANQQNNPSSGNSPSVTQSASSSNSLVETGASFSISDLKHIISNAIRNTIQEAQADIAQVTASTAALLSPSTSKPALEDTVASTPSTSMPSSSNSGNVPTVSNPPSVHSRLAELESLLNEEAVGLDVEISPSPKYSSAMNHQDADIAQQNQRQRQHHQRYMSRQEMDMDD